MTPRGRPPVLQRIQYYYRQKDLLVSYIRKDLRERYVGSFFGFYWSVINPLILLGIYTFVFSVIFKVRFGDQPAGLAHSALFIYCGMVPWMAFHESVGRCTGVLVDNANLLKKVMFPAKILPMYLVLSHVVNLAIGMVILALAGALAGSPPTPCMLFLPLLIGLQVALTLGLGWIAAAVNVFVRDMAQLINQVLVMWMYLSPIFYSLDVIPEDIRRWSALNPWAALVESYRDVMLRGRVPDLAGLGVFALFALGVFFAGYFFFNRFKHEFADVL